MDYQSSNGWSISSFICDELLEFLTDNLSNNWNTWCNGDDIYVAHKCMNYRDYIKIRVVADMDSVSIVKSYEYTGVSIFMNAPCMNIGKVGFIFFGLTKLDRHVCYIEYVQKNILSWERRVAKPEMRRINNLSCLNDLPIKM